MGTTMTVDQDALQAFVGNAVEEFGAIVSAALVVIGDKVGLYRAMAGAGPLTPADLPNAPGPTSSICGPGWSIKRPAATSHMTRRPVATGYHRNKPWP